VWNNSFTVGDNFFHGTSYEQASEYCHGWWVSSSIGQNPTFPVAATRDEILSWMIKIWMEKLVGK
jgi:hypothetical protein